MSSAKRRRCGLTVEINAAPDPPAQLRASLPVPCLQCLVDVDRACLRDPAGLRRSRSAAATLPAVAVVAVVAGAGVGWVKAAHQRDLQSPGMWAHLQHTAPGPHVPPRLQPECHQQQRRNLPEHHLQGRRHRPPIPGISRFQKTLPPVLQRTPWASGPLVPFTQACERAPTVLPPF